MPGFETTIAASGGSAAFDTYIALPDSGPGPGVIIMCSVYGVTEDVRAMADEMAARGFAAAAPDLFWRGDAGPLGRDEDGMRRAKARGGDRAAIIERGMADLADTMADLKARPECNGRIAVIGLCYGGPYAILGPARLGCAAGLAFHGTRVQDYLDRLDAVDVPLSLHWGDQDHAAPPADLARIQAAVAGKDNAEVVVYPGVKHGYSEPEAVESYDADATERSFARAYEIIARLRGAGESLAGAAQ